ncbi:hypothetical protein HYDPIDRAFT_31453 [Hydnomerulius pinastri MD-312]|uniref:Tc1-like transposase DDE domain-containing protein n=1 Tax=Hydnomerulius pinastri MD-312 TaxID=994086 RepID=A0A0C9W4H2_9AGAM|nr:hypothetical protein HYDPIDRAFT_31453 [Hydnomerulius pinastri MD-312]
MMWGCITWEGAGYAAKIDGRMDGDLYRSILEDELLETLRTNDPKHTCKKVKNWLEEQEFRTMKWPAQSADLNPIEHIWCYLKKRLGEYEIPAKGIEELWKRVEKEWNKIPASVC